MTQEWLIWQLADSAFPAGGFTHSNGLEAAHQLGIVRNAEDLEEFLRCQLGQTARGIAPLMAAAYREPDELERIDAACDLFLNQPVANRASRSQGRGLLAAAVRSYPLEAWRRWTIAFGTVARRGTTRRSAGWFSGCWGLMKRNPLGS